MVRRTGEQFKVTHTPRRSATKFQNRPSHQRFGVDRNKRPIASPAPTMLNLLKPFPELFRRSSEETLGVPSFPWSLPSHGARLLRMSVIKRSRSGNIQMRSRLQKYLPIFLLALAVQVLAPIGACWAAAVAASDPLNSVEICHSGLAGDRSADPGGESPQHLNGCSLCCLASAASSVDTPAGAAFAIPYRESTTAVWHPRAPDPSSFGVGWHAQARAPPSLS